MLTKTVPPPLNHTNSYPCIPLHWWQGYSNFGDELSPYLIEKITGIKTRYAQHQQREHSAKLVAIGSLLSDRLLRPCSVIWGTGTLQKTSFGHKNKSVRWFPLNRKIKSIFFPSSPDIRAVRGPVTRSLLIKNGYACPEIYGDPAILLPDYYRPKQGKKHRIGVILHWSHSDISVDLSALVNENATLISIKRHNFEEIEQFIDEVCACERIFSTSLHGVIVAQAYGIPAQWIRINNKPIHDDESMKFEDYFLGACQENQKPLVFSELNSVALAKMATHQPFNVKEFKGKKQLLDAFPWDITNAKNQSL